MQQIEIQEETKVEGGHSFRQKISVSYRLYRHFDKQQQLLYVGISLRSFQRLAEHREYSHWFEDIANVTFESFSNKDDALLAEKTAIQTEKPRFNLIHNTTQRSKVRVEDVEERPAVTRSREKLTGLFRPTYTLGQAADALNISADTLSKLIKNGEISVIKVPRRVITGWQLIEFLERLDQKMGP